MAAAGQPGAAGRAATGVEADGPKTAGPRTITLDGKEWAVAARPAGGYTRVSGGETRAIPATAKAAERIRAMLGATEAAVPGSCWGGRTAAQRSRQSGRRERDPKRVMVQPSTSGFPYLDLPGVPSVAHDARRLVIRRMRSSEVLANRLTCAPRTSG